MLSTQNNAKQVISYHGRNEDVSDMSNLKNAHANCAKLLFFIVKCMLPLLWWLLTVSSLFLHPVGGATASNTWLRGMSLTVDVVWVKLIVSSF